MGLQMLFTPAVLQREFYISQKQSMVSMVL